MDELTLFMPPNLENMTLPSPELLNYYRLAEHRMFFIDFDIDENLTEIIKNIIYINKCDAGIERDKRDPIYLFIYSYGVDLQIAYSLISICEASGTPIITVNMGVAMSAGLLILLAGCKRYAIKRSRALIHSGSAKLSGTYEEIKENQKSYDNMVDTMQQYILEHTKISSRLFKKNKTKDWYIEDKEMVEYGIVDGIIENISDIWEGTHGTEANCA